MRTFRVRSNRVKSGRRSRSSYIFSLSTACILILVGLFTSLPFAYYMIFTKTVAVMSLGKMIATFLMVIGLPMFFTGLIGVFARRGMRYDQTSSDISRIRFAVESKSNRSYGHEN